LSETCNFTPFGSGLWESGRQLERPAVERPAALQVAFGWTAGVWGTIENVHQVIEHGSGCSAGIRGDTWRWFEYPLADQGLFSKARIRPSRPIS